MNNYNTNITPFQQYAEKKAKKAEKSAKKTEKADVSYKEISDAFHAEKDVFLQRKTADADKEDKGEVLIYSRVNHVLRKISPLEIGVFLEQTGIDYSSAFLSNIVTRVKYKKVSAERFLSSETYLDNHRLLCKNMVFIADPATKTLEVIDRAEYKGAPFFHELNFSYSKQATRPPIFDAFLRSLGVGEKVEKLICQMIGSAILPCTNDNLRHVYIMVGPGENGKSVLMKLIKAIVGSDLVYEARLSDLDPKERQFGPAGLKCANVCLVREAKDGRIDTDVIKSLGSGEEIGIEVKHKQQDSKSFINHSVSIICACNELPQYTDEQAVKSRCIIIPLFKTFEIGNPERDELIFAKLLSEIDLTASWCLDEYLNAMTGKDQLERCADAAAAVLSKDSLGSFILESFEANPKGFIHRTQIPTFYADFQTAAGFSLEGDPYVEKDGKAKPNFYNKLIARIKSILPGAEAAIYKKVRQGKDTIRCLCGVSLKEKEKEPIPLPMKKPEQELLG